jgi:hypothetical protein
MGALLNYLIKSKLVTADTVDEEQAVRQLKASIKEMLVATARHHAGLQPLPGRQLRQELGASRMERIQELLSEARAAYPSLNAQDRYLLVEAANPELFENAGIELGDYDSPGTGDTRP